MIGDVSLLSGHVVTSLSRFVAFLLSVGVWSQDVELFTAHSLRAGGATAAAIGQLSQHSLPTADTAAAYLRSFPPHSPRFAHGPSHPTAHEPADGPRHGPAHSPRHSLADMPPSLVPTGLPTALPTRSRRSCRHSLPCPNGPADTTTDAPAGESAHTGAVVHSHSGALAPPHAEANPGSVEHGPHPDTEALAASLTEAHTAAVGPSDTRAFGAAHSEANTASVGPAHAAASASANAAAVPTTLTWRAGASSGPARSQCRVSAPRFVHHHRHLLYAGIWSAQIGPRVFRKGHGPYAAAIWEPATALPGLISTTIRRFSTQLELPVDPGIAYDPCACALA